MHTLVDRSLESLREGMQASFSARLTEAELAAFRELTGDDAPVHSDTQTAAMMGYPNPIAYGFLIFSRFSGLLGMVLPGPRTVIHSASYRMAEPVYAGDELIYRVEVKRVVASVRTVLLGLTVTRAPSDVVLRGEAQCGFLA